MLRRGWRCKREHAGDINEKLNQCLSFLDSDPEVSAVVEAHEIIEHISKVVDALLLSSSGGRGISIKHVCQRGQCYFELWYKDDTAIVDTRQPSEKE